MSKAEWKDLITFEGNAQGLRILSGRNSGLKVTMATLGAFSKYPLSSSSQKEKGRKSQKKFGYYQSDAFLFSELATQLSLIKVTEGVWCRHPLTFLVEAADDICYHIIDLEDGCRLGLISFEVVKELLANVIGNSFSEEKLNKIPSLNEKLGILRAMAINKLIAECSEAFEANEQKMIRGEFDLDLTSLIPSSDTLNAIIQLSVNEIYRSKLVLEKEAGGFQVIDHLIETFSTTAYYHYFDQPLPKHKSTLRLIPEEYKVLLDRCKSVYDALQIVIDFISGLTDSHAVRLYKTLTGNRF